MCKCSSHSLTHHTPAYNKKNPTQFTFTSFTREQKHIPGSLWEQMSPAQTSDRLPQPMDRLKVGEVITAELHRRRNHSVSGGKGHRGCRGFTHYYFFFFSGSPFPLLKTLIESFFFNLQQINCEAI